MNQNYYFTCSKCSKQLKYKKNLIRHEKDCKVGDNGTRNGVCCPDCKLVFGRMGNLRFHVEQVHEVPQVVEEINFKTRNEFEEWKKQVEKEELCFYYTKRSSSYNGQTRNYLYCHRSGFFKSESKGERRIKSQGTNKISATCTSAIVVTEYDGGNINVTYHKTHFGHGSNLGRCRSTGETKKALTKQKKENTVKKRKANVIEKIEVVLGLTSNINIEDWPENEYFGIIRNLDGILNVYEKKKKVC